MSDPGRANYVDLLHADEPLAIAILKAQPSMHKDVRTGFLGVSRIARATAYGFDSAEDFGAAAKRLQEVLAQMIAEGVAPEPPKRIEYRQAYDPMARQLGDDEDDLSIRRY